jgi:hypothetical protein
MPPLTKDALAACESALRQLGFSKRRGSLLQDGATAGIGWIGLNTATRGLPGRMGVNPVVGMYFARLAEIESVLRDDIPDKPMPAMSMPLGYLMPDRMFRQWEFPQGGDLALIAQSLADAVQAYGQPYIGKYADWDTFSHDVVESPNMLMEHERAKTLPLVLAINGKLEEAKRIVERELDSVSGVEGVYAQSYRDFADKFFARFTNRSR